MIRLANKTSSTLLAYSSKFIPSNRKHSSEEISRPWKKKHIDSHIETAISHLILNWFKWCKEHSPLVHSISFLIKITPISDTNFLHKVIRNLHTRTPSPQKVRIESIPKSSTIILVQFNDARKKQLVATHNLK